MPTEPRSAPKLDCYNLPSIREIGCYMNELVESHHIVRDFGSTYGSVPNPKVTLGARDVVGEMGVASFLEKRLPKVGTVRLESDFRGLHETDWSILFPWMNIVGRGMMEVRILASLSNL